MLRESTRTSVLGVFIFVAGNALCFAPALAQPRVFFHPENLEIPPGEYATLKLFLENPSPSAMPPFDFEEYQMVYPEFGAPMVGTVGTLVGEGPASYSSAHASAIFPLGLDWTAAPSQSPPPSVHVWLMNGPINVGPGTWYLCEFSYYAQPGTDGSFEISLLNPNDNGGSYLKDSSGAIIPFANTTPGAVVTVRNPWPQIVQLDPPVTYPAALPQPEVVVTADFDNDGDEDIAVADWDGTTTFLTNNGAGAFAIISQNLFPAGIEDMLAVDIDADGYQDLLAVWGDVLTVQWNDGTGQFHWWLYYGQNVGGGLLKTLAATDVDQDCDIDVVTMNQVPPPDPQDTKLVVLLNANGLFTFVTQMSFDTPPGTGISHEALAVGDMNGDGNDDVVICEWNVVSVLYNDGAGGFSTFIASNLSESTVDGRVPVLGDWDQDGDLDVAMGGGALWIAFNTDGSGSFGDMVSYSAANGFSPSKNMIATDIDGDHDLDLVSSSTSPPARLQIMINSGAGTFVGPQDVLLPPGSGPQPLTAADFDADGTRDVAVLLTGSAEVATLRNTGFHDCDHDNVEDTIQPTGTMTVAVVGAPNGTLCHWSVNGGGFLSHGELCVYAGGTEEGFTQALVESINANSCPTIRAARVPCPISGAPNCLEIVTPDPNFALCVGTQVLPASPASCFTSSAATLSVATCNPDLVLLSETDCNDNDVDDALDLYYGTSTDENGDGVPDDCSCAFGDVDCNGLVNLDDILRVLVAFTQPPSQNPNADIHPCAGNGLINLDDILWVLSAFGGANLCP